MKPLALVAVVFVLSSHASTGLAQANNGNRSFDAGVDDLMQTIERGNNPEIIAAAHKVARALRTDAGLLTRFGTRDLLSRGSSEKIQIVVRWLIDGWAKAPAPLDKERQICAFEMVDAVNSQLIQLVGARTASITTNSRYKIANFNRWTCYDLTRLKSVRNKGWSQDQTSLNAEQKKWFPILKQLVFEKRNLPTIGSILALMNGTNTVVRHAKAILQRGPR